MITQPTTTQPIALPQLIYDVKPAHGGYRIYSDGKWTFYATCCLSDEEARRLDWLVDEYRKVN